MELSYYLLLIRRWFWLVVIVGFVFGTISYIRIVSLPSTYRTQTTISIGNAYAAPNPNASDLSIGEELVLTYQQLVRTYDVLQGVVDSLQLPFSSNFVNGVMSVRTVPGTTLMQISVTYTDPVLAAEIANEIARQLIINSPTNLTEDQLGQVQLLQGEIEQQQRELSSLREQLGSIDASLLNGNLPEERENELLAQRSAIIDQINTASANLAQYTNTVATFQRRTNSVEIVESARIPNAPIRRNVAPTVIVAAIFGAALAYALVLIYEYFNETFRTADEASKHLNLPILGVISRFGRKRDTYQDRLVTNTNTSRVLEEYNTLRSNLLFTVSSNRLFVISSSAPTEGKTLTSCNMAAAIALSGLRVLLIDADLRRPKVHQAFGIENQMGLANLLTSQETQTTQSGERVFNENDWVKTIHKTDVANLYIMPSGFSPANPSALLGSVLMKRWIEIIQKTRSFDVIILDTPPVLSVSDSTVLAASIGAKAILVVSANSTHRLAALKAKERFEHLNLPIVGVVLNKVNLRDETYYTGYRVYNYYYKSTEGSQQPINAPNNASA